jgi:hypothetical protein
MAHSSIGNMTNTLIETGARHMQQCRTNYDVLLAMADGKESELINNENKWCMAKDELVVSCGKHMTQSSQITAAKYAYPSVVTTLGGLNEIENNFLRCHYHYMGRMAPKDIQTHVFKTADATGKSKQFRNFIPVGYSVGKASAHGYQGDTVASVQIGGLRTVINGAFEMQTGDLVQMYIPCAERCMFNAHGGRLDDLNAVDHTGKETISQKEQSRRAFYERGNGMPDPGSSDTQKQGMFSIKPYVESMNVNNKQYYGDKIRVFAKALSCARPYEPVDIMIARQSM